MWCKRERKDKTCNFWKDEPKPVEFILYKKNLEFILKKMGKLLKNDKRDSWSDFNFKKYYSRKYSRNSSEEGKMELGRPGRGWGL